VTCKQIAVWLKVDSLQPSQDILTLPVKMGLNKMCVIVIFVTVRGLGRLAGNTLVDGEARGMEPAEAICVR
jgi:hypothetical protein